MTAPTVTDTLFFPVLEDALGCLTAALALNPNPPALYSIRPGILVTEDFGASIDECCSGSAWVKLNDAWPSQIFPERISGALPCNSAPSWAMEIQLGVYRCAPTGTLQAPPTSADWLAAEIQIMNDAQAMRTAQCCMVPTLSNGQPVPNSIAVTGWTPVEVAGGCTGGTFLFTVQVFCPVC